MSDWESLDRCLVSRREPSLFKNRTVDPAIMRRTGEFQPTLGQVDIHGDCRRSEVEGYGVEDTTRWRMMMGMVDKRDEVGNGCINLIWGGRRRAFGTAMHLQGTTRHYEPGIPAAERRDAIRSSPFINSTVIRQKESWNSTRDIIRWNLAVTAHYTSAAPVSGMSHPVE